MAPIPYIGITDFMTFEQVQQMLSVFKANCKTGQHRRLHVGVMMSQKTLNGLETKWSKAFPGKEVIADIFGSSETMNCLHYADYEDHDLLRNLIQAITWGGENINALQLDMVWPSPNHIAEAIRVLSTELEVILQLNAKALAQCDNEPQKVVELLRNYQGVVDHVLLDKSAGKGLGMDALGLLPFARAIREAFPDLGLVAAGGLGPNTMGLVEPLLEEFPNISIDAQGRLRPSGNALDPIDWDLAEGYLIEALRILK